MRFSPTLFTVIFSSVLVAPIHATEPAADATAATPEKITLVDRASLSIRNALDDAMGLIGIRYQRGGTSPESGFDCSGFVRHVFQEGMGLVLPRSAKELSKEGEAVKKEELKPGDLVFFNTMRRTFSHVGIYLGGNLFVHAPRAGGKVRIEDMSEQYWAKRYNGARRVGNE